MLTFYSPIYTLFHLFEDTYHRDKANKLNSMLCTILKKSCLIKIDSDIDLIYKSEPSICDILAKNGYTEDEMLLFHNAMNEIDIEFMD